MKILTKHCLSRLLGVIIGFAAIGAAANTQNQLLDQIIAIVDDDVVLASELNQRLSETVKRIQASGQTLPPMQELQQQLLDLLIVENIQLQMANRAGVRISDAQLNEAMTRLARQNNVTLDQFRQLMERDGVSYAATREQIRKEMMLRQVQQGNVNRRVSITEQEIKNFLATEEGQTITAPEYRMLHTLIAVDSQRDAAAAKQLAQRLYQRIASGQSYESVIAADPTLNSTDFGWQRSKDLPSLVADYSGSLDKGETAQPFESASGYHLIKMVDKRGDGQLVQQTRARHILLKSSAIRDEAATKAQLQTLRQQVLDGSDFAELAREYSEDIGSASEGGDLGWTTPGQLVEAFQNTMDNTGIDQISLPFRSQFGWHILQVQERRDKDFTDTMRSNIAYNYLHRRKYDDELQTWLQKIRDEAYVDFK